MMNTSILILSLGLLAVALGATTIPDKGVKVPKENKFGIMAAQKTIYIVDSSLGKLYTDAKRFCALRGWQLLSLDSAWEAQWMMNYLKQNGHHGHYWTSGKKPAGSKSYKWESTNQLIAPGLVKVYDFEVPYEYCLTLGEDSFASIGPLPPPSGTWYTFFTWSCDAKASSIICQSY